MRPSDRYRSRDHRFTWIIILLLIQSILLTLVLLERYEIISLKPKPPVLSGFPLEETAPALEPVPQETEVSPAEVARPIKVEVLNGCAVAGIARKTADFLRGKGYDVRDFKNWPGKPVKHTAIFVRSGVHQMGENLANAIALPLEMVKDQPDTSLIDIDVTLLLGRDYKRYILPQ